MSPQMIKSLLEQKPFAPFAVRLSSGEVHRVSHPELGWLAGSTLYIYYPERDRVAWCSLLHVTSAEHQPNASTESGLS
jgi:hypothetical protein